ncbi:putative ABC transport system permease protein [Streptomyces sp. TLI_053]|uniref:ABC transporter permease n=1 Tax=Streptomyces sp. TLI_053 TaxID=1855352 RepID=UPI00087B7ABF|nr:ABC transporter permease [Streptomyces sp. TLI_053]SDS57778.1 putative ABC transport system permease protein [Streptomyces sp. TLI_053]
MKLPRSRMSFRDLASEAVAGVLQRPARSALTAVGTVLGVGTLIAVTGLTSTAASQIDARFSELTATEVTVDDIAPQTPGQNSPAFPADADARIEALRGVTAAGVSWHVRLPTGQSVASGPPGATYSVTDRQAQLVAASAGTLRATEPALRQGRAYDDFHDRHRQRVALLGATTAARLGITDLRAQPAVFIGSTPFSVIGIINDVRRRPDLLTSVIVPRTTAEELWGPPTDDRAKMLITTRLGAATQVAAEAPLALRPEHPDHLRATPPPDPRSLRTGVENDLGQLFLLLATVCLVIGAVGIANTTLVAVLERSGEIGLRRALGARAGHITAQFLAESTMLGLLGGLAGACLGTVTIVAVAAAKQWTPVLHPATIATAPLLGLATGLIAGVYPAWRASRIQPAEALRR